MTSERSRSLRFLAVLFCFLLGLGASLVQADDALLTLTGADGKTIRLTAEDLAKLPRQKVQVDQSTFEGVPLVEVVRLAGAPLGDAFRHHEPPTWHVVLDAKDGYKALFALPELDPAFTDKTVLLADRKDGKPLAAGEGPFRLVVPADKRRARWVEQVTGLRVGHL